MKEKITILVVGLLLGLFLGIFISKSKPVQTPKPVVETQYRIVYRIKGTPVLVNKGEITIGEDGESSKPTLTLISNDYPNLFYSSKDLMADQISVEGATDTKNKNEYAVLTRERFSAGSFTPGYFIIVNLNTRKVVYESPKSYQATRFSTYSFSTDGSEISISWNPYYFNSSVTNTMLPIIEFASFDKTKGSFTLSNTSHKQSFNDLLKQYDNYEIECPYHGKKMTAKEVSKQYGEDKRCDDNLIPDKPKYDPEGFITVGQFEKIRENIKKILNGENISMIDS